MTRSWHPPVPQQGAAERWRHDGWKPTQPRRSDTAHLEPSGEVGNGGGTTATSGQSPAASVVAARSCVETNDPVQRHSITPITTPFTPGTTRLAAGSWPLEAHTATTLRHSSPLAKSGTVAALRLPAASRQQPAWLRRALVWRRTTRCSGTLSRPSPHHSHPAQPG